MDTWNLELLYKIKDIDKFIINFPNKIESFTKLLNTLKPTINSNDFKHIISSFEKIYEELLLVHSRIYLAEELNSNDLKIKEFSSKLQNILIKFNSISICLFNYIKGKEKINNKYLDDKNAIRLFKSLPNLKYFLNRQRTLKKHSLENSIEDLIIKKDTTGINTLLNIRTNIENSQSYSFLKGKKNIKCKTLGDLSKYLINKNRNTRINSYNSMLKEFNKNRLNYFLIYESIVKNYNYEKDLRNYSSAINLMNIENDIPDETVNSLINSCVSNISIFHKFFKYKSEVLKIKDFSRYDINAPTDSKNEFKINVSEAKKSILNIYKEFHPEFYEKALILVNNDLIDYYPKKNKKSGGFCATITPNNNPRILLNYTNTIRDFITMGHEIGHGIHTMFSKKQSILTFNSPLILAETGSTIGELLVFNYLIKNSKNNNIKRNILINKITDLYSSIIRQIYFVKFEIEAHKIIPNGISIDELDNLYYSLLKEQYGNSINIPKVFKNEWLLIPHIFHTPFYCYSYAFGQLLGISLFNLINEDKNNIEKVIKLFESGSSRPTIELLKNIGLDINNIWDNGFKYINTMIEELMRN